MLIRPNLSASDNRRIQAMLRGNQNGDLAQMLLDGAPFLSELTHTAVPQRAAAGTTAAFTRATTATFTDFEGVLRTAPAGCARFVGARFVRNLLTGTTTLATQNVTTEARTYLLSFYGTGSVALSGTVTDSLAGTGANNRVSEVYTATAGTLTLTVTGSVTSAQLEDITGRADQTRPSEYVSVGVPSDWAGDELVTNGDFSNGTTGWTAGNSAVLAAVNGELRITNGASSNGYAYQAIPVVVGQKYIVSATGRCGTSASINTNLGSTLVGSQYGGVFNLTTSNAPLNTEFTATGTTFYLAVVIDATLGTTGFFDNISVKPAYYHGSFVDGVKCFPTDLSGNPIAASINTGYLAEGARTNTCLQSNAFTTAPWVELSFPGATQNATGPNGQANYAWTLTDSDAAYEGLQQNNVAWAAGASGCYSILVGKKASSPSYPLLLMYYNRASNLYHYIIVNEVAGTVAIGGSTNPPAYGCVSYNDDFWLVWVTGTQAGATVLASLDLYPAGSTDGTTLSAAATGSTVFADAQFESGATFPSSRIPTTTAAVTRNADVLTYPSSGNVSGTAGWCYAEFDVTNDSDGNQNILLGSDVAGVFPLYAQPSLGNVRTLDGTNAPIAQSAPMVGIRKGAGTWGGSTLQCAHNGVVSTTTAFDGNMEVTSVLRVGEDNAGNSHLFGTIRNLRIGQRQLSASEMQAITS